MSIEYARIGRESQDECEIQISPSIRRPRPHHQQTKDKREEENTERPGIGDDGMAPEPAVEAQTHSGDAPGQHPELAFISQCGPDATANSPGDQRAASRHHERNQSACRCPAKAEESATRQATFEIGKSVNTCAYKVHRGYPGGCGTPAYIAPAEKIPENPVVASGARVKK